MSSIKLKICGVQSAEEARQLVDIGVDYLGLNFVLNSPRVVSIDTAEVIARVLKDLPVQIITLFRNAPLELVVDYAARLGADYVQLHGTEPFDYAAQIRVPVIRAIAGDPEKAADIVNFVKAAPYTYFVLDRIEQGRGALVDLGLAKQVIAAQPDKIFLAGGLGPDNLAKVLSQVQPYGIDIASGVRTDGKLDMSKVAACRELIQKFS